MNNLKRVSSILIAIMITVASYGVVFANGAEAPDGAALYEKKCSICHTIKRSKSKKKSEKLWRKTVMRMMKNGAPISDEEAEIIIKHLADNYGR